MSDDLKHLEAKIEELASRLRRVEQKVFSASFEGTVPGKAQERIPQKQPDEETAAGERIGATAILSFIGRSLVVLGGAFLLRWLTQAGILPHKLGSVIGMIYALLWIAMADFKAGRGQRHSAVFHGITGSCIALPLLVEVTTKFHYLTPMLSAIHLPAFIILGLVVAGRQNLRILAWIITLPAAPLAFFLAIQTDAMTPFLISLLILGFVTLWLGYLRHWHVLATLMSAAVNFGLALMVMEQAATGKRAGVEQQAGMWEVLALLFALIALYFGSYCFRVFKRKRTITALEIGHTLVVVLIGLGGAAIVINAYERSMFPLGIGCLVLSIASYTAAYGLLPRRDPNRRNFLFYTSLAVAMVLLGSELSLGGPAAAVSFTLIALIAGSLAKRIASPILFLHGAVYLIASIFRSGLLKTSLSGLVGPSLQYGEWSSAAVLSALAVTLIYPWLPRPQGRSIDMVLGRISVNFFLFMAIHALAALMISLLAQMIPAGENADAFRRPLASLRTGTLAVCAAILAGLSNRTRFGNLAWLVYAILVLGGVKLIGEDIAAGGAATLFLSLGLYGGTLILSPRLLQRSAKRKAESTQAP